MPTLALVLLLILTSCARVPRVRLPPMCADGLPPQVLTDIACPPDSICGYSCLPGRWKTPQEPAHPI